MRNILLLLAILTMPLSYASAQKKVLNHEDSYSIWKSIEGRSISRDGNWISYYLESVNDDGNTVLKLKDNKGITILEYQRGNGPKFTYDSKQLVFRIKPD